MPTILGANTLSAAYDVDQSVMLETNAYFSRSSSGGNQNTFTVSFWCKRTAFATGSHHYPLSFYQDANNRVSFAFLTGNSFIIYAEDGGAGRLTMQTSALFKDPSAWYHVVIAFDTTQGTESDRLKLYINGTQVTDFADITYPTQNRNLIVNTTHYIGTYDTSNNPFHGYLAEFVYVDGQQLLPTSFGQFDSDSPNIWKPKSVSGLTFGSAGYYLDFATRATDPIDASGNGNNFSSTNVLAIDHSNDTCTNNFCTFIPTDPSADNFELSEGNLKTRRTTGTSGLFGTSIMPTTGKWYFEVKIGEAGNSDRSRVGVMNFQSYLDNNYTGVINTPQQVLKGVTTSCKVGKHFVGTGSGVTEYTASGDFADDDFVNIAMDLDNKAVYIGRNGTYLTQTGSSGGDPTSGASKTGAISDNTTILDGSPMTPYTGLSVGSGSDTSEMFFNFGNPPFSISSGNADANGYGNFEYAPPAGYYAICSKNLAEYG